MGTKIYPKAKKAEENDYIKFKKFLRFFVRQAEKNAKNGCAESPTMNKARNASSRNKPEFAEHYGLAPEFHKIAGLDFTIRFFNNGKYGTEFTTYINIRQFDITGKFRNEKITHLRNFIRVDTGKFEYTGEPRRLCDEWNKTHQRFYSIEELGIDKDNNDPPNDTLRKMLDEYLKCYNDLFEIAEESAREK